MNKKVVIILISIISLIMLIVIGEFLLYPKFELKNNTGILGEEYKPDIKVYNKLFDITDKAKIKNKVNINEIGNQEIEVSVKILFIDVKEKFTVLILDKESPVITLKGSETITLYLKDTYKEPGYEAIDNYDKDITDKVEVENNIDNTKEGSYVVKYKVSDSSKNSSEVERKVNVKKRPVTYGNGKIYLTFDDGSSYVTNKILDVLKKENVKATFFIVNPNNYTKRAYELGHTIALHSNTHDYKYIYSSTENYFQDLEAVRNKVYNLTGFNANIIRFPGGASNTISKRYKPGIMSILTREVTNKGYKYFDWNIDSNDMGSDKRNSNNIYKNVTRNLSHNKTNVVLMHDTGSNTATLEALDDIIRFGKENGYQFEAITNNTPLVQHSVRN